LVCLRIFFALTLSVSAAAQYNQEKRPMPKGANGETLTTQYIKTGLYLITGGGCNSVLRLTGDGIILVDSKLPGRYEAVVAQANRISDQAVRGLILTGPEPCRNGNNAKFMGAGARIIAHQNVLGGAKAATANSGSAASVMSFDHDFRFRLGGVEVQLLHPGNGPSNGDAVVYFPGLRVVAVGDLYSSAPNPDYSAGGSLLSWGPALAEVLKLDFDTVVPGQGPPVTRAELESFKTRIDTLVTRASELVKQGVTKDQFMSRLKTDDLAWRPALSAAQVDGFYQELAAQK
jgi:glyoxylase-like metal-dependent hydrolase (beta-lactamase superfamily II)